MRPPPPAAAEPVALPALAPEPAPPPPIPAASLKPTGGPPDPEAPWEDARDLIGRMVARRYRLYNAYFWYLGVIEEVEDLPPRDAGSESDDEDEPGQRHLAICLMEDGATEEATVNILMARGCSTANLTLCAVGPHGRPLRAARRTVSSSPVTSGLLLGSEETEVTVLSAVYCDELGPCGSLTYGTCTDRASESSQRHNWGFEEVPDGLWPPTASDVRGIAQYFEGLWLWVHSPAAPAARAPLPAPVLAGPPSKRPRRRPRAARAATDYVIPRSSRRITTAPEAVDDAVPLEHRAAFHRLTTDLGPTVLYGFRPEDRVCTLEGMQERLFETRRSPGQKARPYRPRCRYGHGADWRRGQLADSAADAEVSALGLVLMGGKRRTVLKRRSNVEGFRQACASRHPPTAMLPLTAENVIHWWTRSWLKGLRMTRLDSCLAAVTAHAKTMGHDLDSPYPGIDPFVREHLILAMKALKDLDGSGVRRAFPITLRLLGFLQSGRQQNLADLEDLQFWARALVAHSAMLRAEDHCRGRPRWGDWKELPLEGPGRATWMIRPGKAHKTPLPAEFGTYPSSLGPSAEMCTMSCYVMARYRAALRDAYTATFNAPPGPDVFLFPAIDLGVFQWSRYASDKQFLNTLRAKAHAVGCPPALCARLQFHGFRSGGASDWFNFGHGRFSIIQFIMRQGRWNSTAFRIYIRLRGSAVASVMNEVFAEARRDAPENTQAGQPMHALMADLQSEDHHNRAGGAFASGPLN